MIKTVTLLLLFWLVSGVSHAGQSLPFATQQRLHSEVLGEDRTYFVYLPPSYEESDRRYPVIYVLDGDVHRLKAVAGMLEGLSTETLGRQVTEAIVVAIPNSENAIRERDLTPTNIPQWTFKDRVLDEFDGNIGNAANYLRFFKQELIPAINAAYRTSDKRVLVGESFGGLFAANALLTDSSVFSDYLIIDPTSLWDNNYLNRTYKQRHFAQQHPVAKVFIGFANNSALGDIGNTNYTWGNEFATSLQQNVSDNFTIKTRYFEHETHGTVAMLSWYYGLKYLLTNE